MKFLLLCMWAGEQIKKMYQNGCHLKTISQYNQKSTQHISGINTNIHTKNEVSMTMLVGEQIKQKYHKIFHLKTTSQND